MYKLKVGCQMLSLGFPFVVAGSNKENKDNELDNKNSLFMKASQLPIYERPEDLCEYEYHGKEKGSLEDGISVIRKELVSTLEITREARDNVKNFYSTGKAHTVSSIVYLREDENVAARAGAIAAGGLLGLLFAFRRGVLKKLIYTSIGAGGVAAVCYPKEAFELSKDAVSNVYNVGEYAAIGYNFVVGVKPQTKDGVADKKQDEKKAPVVTQLPKTIDAPSKVPEVRTRNSLEFLAEQASDVTVWGFRLKHYISEDHSSNSSKHNNNENIIEPPDKYGKKSDFSNLKKIGEDVIEIAAAETVKKGAEDVNSALHKISEFSENVEGVNERIEKVSNIVKTSAEFIKQAGILSHEHPQLENAIEEAEMIADKIGLVASEVDKVSDFVNNIDQSVIKITDKIETVTMEVIEDKNADIVSEVQDILDHEIKDERKRSFVDKVFSFFSTKANSPEIVKTHKLVSNSNVDQLLSFDSKALAVPQSQTELEIRLKPENNILMEDQGTKLVESSIDITSFPESHSNLSNIPILIIPESQIVSNKENSISDYDERMHKIEMLEDVFINAMLRMQQQDNESKPFTESSRKTDVEDLSSNLVQPVSDAFIDISTLNEKQNKYVIDSETENKFLDSTDHSNAEPSTIENKHLSSKLENKIKTRPLTDIWQVDNEKESKETDSDSISKSFLKVGETDDLQFIEPSGYVFSMSDAVDDNFNLQNNQMQETKTENEANNRKQNAKAAKDVILKMDQTIKKTVEGDIGQSNPEDSDMYTTRS